MSKMKRAVAIALAAAMTMGSTLTVFADDTGSGTTSGKGENEGHVKKEVINVVLPVVPETDGSPFEYVTDPERLIQETAGAKYEDYTFPAKGTDTGVYFRVGEKEFSNTSEVLQVINKSSCNMKITVKAKATASAGGKDLKIATKADVDDTDQLYLNLKVGQTDQIISATETPVEKVLSGNKDNFEVQYDGSAYKYVAKDTATDWKAINISLNGAVFEGAVEADTTAPTVDVTWAFEKAGDSDTVATDQVDYEDPAEPAIISISDYVKSDPKKVVIQFSTGAGDQKVDADGAILYATTSKGAVPLTKYTVNMTNKTLTIDNSVGWIANATEDVPVWVALTKDGKEVKELAGTIVIRDDYNSKDPAIVSITEYSKSTPAPVVITFSLGSGNRVIDADGVVLYTMVSGAKTAVNTSKYTVDMANKTVTCDNTAGWIASATEDLPIWVALTKDGEEVKELTGTIKVK